MLRQFAGKSGFTFLVYYVGKGEEDESVPADHSDVEQIREPHEFSNPQDDQHSDQLAEEDTASGTEKRGETPHQRVHFKRTKVKRGQGSNQVKSLQYDEAGFVVQQMRKFDSFAALKLKRIALKYLHPVILAEPKSRA
jgi:hypothetical protein